MDLYWKEDNFKKLYDKMLDTLLEQAKDFDNKAWKMRVTLEKVLTKLRGRISSLKKSREFMMMLEGNLEMTDMSMRISNMSTMA